MSSEQVLTSSFLFASTEAMILDWTLNSLPSINVRSEPPEHESEPLDPVVRLASPRQSVALARENHELDFLPLSFQKSVELLCLFKPTTKILVRVHYQERSAHILCVGNWRL